MAAGGLIVLTNLKTFAEWAGADGVSTGLLCALWALVWLQMIVVAVRAERRTRRVEAEEAAEAALTPA